MTQIVRVCEIRELGVAMDVFRGIQDSAHRLVRITSSDKAFHMLPCTHFSEDPLQHAPGLGDMQGFATCLLNGERV